jgi:hypothetical protein
LIRRIDPLDLLLDRPRQHCEQQAEAGEPDRQALVVRQHEDQKDAACHGEPDRRRQPEQAHHTQRQDAENAADQVEAVGLQRIRALQQSAAKLADRITDARTEHETRRQQHIDRRTLREQKPPAQAVPHAADGGLLVHRAGHEETTGRVNIVTQQRDDTDKKGKHRQHQRRGAWLFVRNGVPRAETEEAGQQGEILEERKHREDRRQPADHDQFEKQADHRHQHDQSDLFLCAGIGK